MSNATMTPLYLHLPSGAPVEAIPSLAALGVDLPPLTAEALTASRSERSHLGNRGSGFSQYNELWQGSGAGSIGIIGGMMAFRRDSGTDRYDEWCSYYLDEHNGEARIATAAKIYHGAVAEAMGPMNGLTMEDAVVHVIYHALDETLSGDKREQRVTEKLRTILDGWEAWGYRVDLVSSQMDKDYSIDAAVYDCDDNLVLGIQIKPISYMYLALGKKGIEEKQKLNQRKNQVKLQRAYGAPTLWVCEDNQHNLTLWECVVEEWNTITYKDLQFEELLNRLP